jgi:hypothetical protein
VSNVSRPDTGTPGWVVATVVVAGVFAAIWVLGLVLSAIGLLIKVVLSIAVLAAAAWFIVNALTGGSRR